MSYSQEEAESLQDLLNARVRIAELEAKLARVDALVYAWHERTRTLRGYQLIRLVNCLGALRGALEGPERP